jgi:hypothetical protein
MNINPENPKFAQTGLIKELSKHLKKNGTSVRKNLRRKASSIEDEPRRLLARLSKQILFILNNQQPLQLKIQNLFRKYTSRNKGSAKEEERTWSTLEATSEKDHGVGSDMLEQGIAGSVYVPTILPHPDPVHQETGLVDKRAICYITCQT